MTRQPIYLTWLNAKGGFEYFFFNARNSQQVDIEGTGVTRNNVLPTWPKSYGNTADTLNRQTFRDSRKSVLLRSQNLSLNQVQVLSYIKSSVLVQIVYSRHDRRTVIPDSNSFQVYDEGQDIFDIQFTLSFTDEIPSQRI
jgi:hypothetical protein